MSPNMSLVFGVGFVFITLLALKLLFEIYTVSKGTNNNPFRLTFGEYVKLWWLRFTSIILMIHPHINREMISLPSLALEAEGCFVEEFSSFCSLASFVELVHRPFSKAQVQISISIDIDGVLPFTCYQSVGSYTEKEWLNVLHDE